MRINYSFLECFVIELSQLISFKVVFNEIRTGLIGTSDELDKWLDFKVNDSLSLKFAHDTDNPFDILHIKIISENKLLIDDIGDLISNIQES